ncbi:hypothetical protein RUND412_010144 [Rhizina undulata]
MTNPHQKKIMIREMTRKFFKKQSDLAKFSTTKSCRRLVVLQKFGEDTQFYAAPEQCCDNCGAEIGDDRMSGRLDEEAETPIRPKRKTVPKTSQKQMISRLQKWRDDAFARKYPSALE